MAHGLFRQRTFLTGSRLQRRVSSLAGGAKKKCAVTQQLTKNDLTPFNVCTPLSPTLACTFAGPQLLCSLGAPSSKIGSVVICKAATSQRWSSTSSQYVKSCWCITPGMRQWRVRLLRCCIYRLHSPHCLENCRISMPLKLQCLPLPFFFVMFVAQPSSSCIYSHYSVSYVR